MSDFLKKLAFAKAYNLVSEYQVTLMCFFILVLWQTCLDTYHKRFVKISRWCPLVRSSSQNIVDKLCQQINSIRVFASDSDSDLLELTRSEFFV